MNIKKSNQITEKMVKEMQELRKQGFTGIEIAKRYKVSETFAYNCTKEYAVKKETKVEQIRRLKGTMTVTEIADQVGVAVSYVSQVLAKKEVCTVSQKKKREKQKEEKKVKEVLERKEEIKEIYKKLREEEEKKKENYKKALAEEIKRLKERFKGIAI